MGEIIAVPTGDPGPGGPGGPGGDPLEIGRVRKWIVLAIY